MAQCSQVPLKKKRPYSGSHRSQRVSEAPQVAVPSGVAQWSRRLQSGPDQPGWQVAQVRSGEVVEQETACPWRQGMVAPVPPKMLFMVAEPTLLICARHPGP